MEAHFVMSMEYLFVYLDIVSQFVMSEHNFLIQWFLDGEKHGINR